MWNRMDVMSESRSFKGISIYWLYMWQRQSRDRETVGRLYTPNSEGMQVWWERRSDRKRACVHKTEAISIRNHVMSPKPLLSATELKRQLTKLTVYMNHARSATTTASRVSATVWHPLLLSSTSWERKLLSQPYPDFQIKWRHIIDLTIFSYMKHIIFTR